MSQVHNNSVRTSFITGLWMSSMSAMACIFRFSLSLLKAGVLCIMWNWDSESILAAACTMGVSVQGNGRNCNMCSQQLMFGKCLFLELDRNWLVQPFTAPKWQSTPALQADSVTHTLWAERMRIPELYGQTNLLNQPVPNVGHKRHLAMPCTFQ